MTSRDNRFEELIAAGSPEGLTRVNAVGGHQVIVKRSPTAAPGFFEAESRGLALLGKAQCLRVPEVWALSAYGIVVQDLGDGRPDSDQWQKAGVQLARQHAVHSPQFGLDHDGWCGNNPQANTPTCDGWRFFAEQRLLPQCRRAQDAGLLDSLDVAAVEALCSTLQERIPEQPPSLLHGDLWTGNLHACANGELALIDAGAVHYGWHEAELAMLTLFGEPPRAFFEAYQHESGCDPGWRQRAPIYNLYYLLNHLNLFGTGYLSAVRGVLRSGTALNRY